MWVREKTETTNQVDLLPEIALAPRILSNYVAALSHNSIKQDLDKFLQTRHQPVNFLAELPARLRLSPQEVCARVRVRVFILWGRWDALFFLVCVCLRSARRQASVLNEKSRVCTPKMWRMCTFGSRHPPRPRMR